MRYHHIPIKMARIKNTDNISADKDVKELDHIYC